MGSALVREIEQAPATNWVTAVTGRSAPPRPTGPILIERGPSWTVAFDGDVLVHRGTIFEEHGLSGYSVARTWLVQRSSSPALRFDGERLEVGLPTGERFTIDYYGRMIAAWLVVLGWDVGNPPDPVFATAYVEPPPWTLPQPPLAQTSEWLEDLDTIE